MKQAQLRISRSNLLHNYGFFKSKLNSSTKIMVMVKADGYGIGDVEISRLTEEFGADYIGVAFSSEGIRLKKAGIKLPVMILTPGIDNFESIIDYGLEPSIVNPESALWMAEELKRKGLHKYPVHIKLDTGMQRMGFDSGQMELLKDILRSHPELEIVSVFSHLAAADEVKHDIFTCKQIDIFSAMSEEIFGILPYKPMRHILNSAGIERFSYAQMDMVRLGIGLYGTGCENPDKLRPPAYLVAPVIHIKTTGEGTVGYGRHGIVGESGKTIAYIQLGYADGIDRRLGCGKTYVQINGKPAPTIGNVCMDTFSVDITGIDVQIGDEAIVFGDVPHPAELAATLETITYELFTSLSSRIERIIVE